MPGLSGLELVGHLKTRNLNPPIVLITVMAISIWRCRPLKWERSILSKSPAMKRAFFPVQFAVAPPTSSHGTYRRRSVEQGNRNAAQSKCEDRQQSPGMGYGANWRPKSRRTCTDGNNHPGAAIEFFSIPLDEAAPARFSQGSA